MELRDYARALAKHWLGIVCIALLTLGAAAVYTYSQPRIYSATAQMFISISTRVVTGTGGQSTVSSSTPYVLQRLTSYVQVVDSPDVLQPVVDELGLETSARGLAGSVSATNPTGTVILEVSATDTDPVRAADIANATAQQLTTVIQDLEAQTAGSSVLVKATLTSPAQPPTSPSSPRTTTNLILGAALGVLLGLGFAVLRTRLDTSVKSQEVVAELTGGGRLGLVPFDPDAQDSPLAAMDTKAVRSEAFRTLRTNLRYVDVDDPPKVITVTSPMPGEGKTTIAINLAIALGQAGWSVCLVEADLRRPTLSRYLGVETSVGLTGVLAGETTLEESLLSWTRGTITVLPSGRVPPNPSELLSSQHMRAALAALRKRFDIVIVDAPPLLPVADGAIVTTASDGAILVVRWGKTTKEQVAAAGRAISQVDGRLLGTVMNFVPTSRRGYGYDYGYGYGYGYSRSASEAASSPKGDEASSRGESRRGSDEQPLRSGG